jgi:putative transposase
VYYRAKPEREENIALMNRIDQLHINKPCYGALRLLAMLKREQYTVGIKRVRKLMKKMSIVPIYPKPNTSKAMPNHKKYPYLLRDRNISRVNEVWSMDITYVKMKRGYMYLTAVIDWHSRYILSWKTSNTMTVEFCKDCLQEAIDKYGHPEIFNTDQGCQFTSTKFTSIWQENNKQEVKISMDGRGRATDNAFIERFWRSVKQEDIYLKNYEDGASLWSGMHNYFADYNNQRPHQSLGYRTPAEIFYQSAYPNAAKVSKPETLSLNREPANTTNLCNKPVQEMGYSTLSLHR